MHHTDRVSHRILSMLPALGASLLLACPSTERCPDGQLWYPDEGVCRTPDGDTGVDAGADGAMPNDVPCGGCTAPQVCDVASGNCVDCLGDDASTCTEAGDNACFGNECVACDSNDDCEDLGMPQCDVASHTCEPCENDDACEGRADATACSAGACVECVSNDQCTGTNEGCDVETNACRTFVPQGGSLCGSCVADAECPTGQLCIPMMFDDPVTVAVDPVFAGNHCLWRSDATGTGAPNGACSTVRPYVATRNLTSVDAVTTDVCSLRVSTCEAQNDFSDPEIPCTLDAAGDALCGRDGLPDGVCRMLDAAANLCTVFCGSDTDCRAGFTCDTVVSPGECRL